MNNQKKKTTAVFLDRDGVICHRHHSRAAERNAEIGSLLGNPDFRLSDQDELRIFFRVFRDPTTGPIGTMVAEEAFWRKWCELLLAENGMPDGTAEARDICDRYPYHTMLEAYEDAGPIIEALRSGGYRLAVISNTFPSLERSIHAIGLGHHFEQFVSSSLVGTSKPDPRIFRIALDMMEVEASESVFVDDVKANADAARDLGFTAFQLDRTLSSADWANCTIHSLTDLCEYLLAE